MLGLDQEDFSIPGVQGQCSPGGGQLLSLDLGEPDTQCPIFLLDLLCLLRVQGPTSFWHTWMGQIDALDLAVGSYCEKACSHRTLERFSKLRYLTRVARAFQLVTKPIYSSLKAGVEVMCLISWPGPWKSPTNHSSCPSVTQWHMYVWLGWPWKPHVEDGGVTGTLSDHVEWHKLSVSIPNSHDSKPNYGQVSKK